MGFSCQQVVLRMPRSADAVQKYCSAPTWAALLSPSPWKHSPAAASAFVWDSCENTSNSPSGWSLFALSPDPTWSFQWSGILIVCWWKDWFLIPSCFLAGFTWHGLAFVGYLMTYKWSQERSMSTPGAWYGASSGWRSVDINLVVLFNKS